MSNRGDCAICLDVRNNPAMTPCMHVFCRSCIGSWLDRHSACPICRHRITRGRRALTTVRDNTTPRRASSAPATPPMVAPAPPARAPRAPARRIPRASQNATASSATARAGNAAVTRAAMNIAAEAAAVVTRNIVPQHRRSNARAAHCTYRCPFSERQALIRSGVPCSCITGADPIGPPPVPSRRLGTASGSRAPRATSSRTATTTGSRMARASTTTRSAPATRRNSPSNSDSDSEFEEILSLALAASVETIAPSSSIPDSGHSSPTDNAIREAMALSLAEAEILDVATPLGATAASPLGATTANDSTLNPGNIFLDALRTAVVGEDDVNADDDSDDLGLALMRRRANRVGDVRLMAIDRTLTAMGVGIMIRRAVVGILRSATSMGSSEDPIDLEADVNRDAVTFRSVSEIGEVLRNMGKSSTEIEGILHALREQRPTPVRL